jgi:hypothetical protein
MSDSAIRSRRALLAGAGGAAAAIAANAAMPVSRVLAVDQPLLLNVANAPTANTTVEGSITGAPVLTIQNDDAGTGGGISGKATGGPGVAGATGTASAGIAGLSGDGSGSPTDTSFTGVFGYSQAGDGLTTFGAGVWGVSDDIGVYGSGSSGVIGDGGTSGTGLEGYSATGWGLYVTGKVRLANRSGKFNVSKNASSFTKNLAGVTTSSTVIAVLQSNQGGTWIRAAVAGTNKFTVYFNRPLTAIASVGWIVLN